MPDSRTLAALTVGLGLSLGLGAPAGAACPRPTTLGELEAEVARAERAYQDLDIETFRAAALGLTPIADCLGEPAGPLDAAAMHRVLGLLAFGERDLNGASAAFSAARRAAPLAVLPLDLVPEGHPVRAAYDAAPVDVATEPAPAAGVGYHQFDGTLGDNRPVGVPVLWQYFDRSGQVVVSGYLRANSEFPEFTPVLDQTVVLSDSSPTDVVGSSPLDLERRSAINVPMAVGAGVAALAAGGMYAVGAASRDAFYADDARLDDLDRLRSRTNSMAWGSSAAGAVALGLGVGVVLTADF